MIRYSDYPMGVFEGYGEAEDPIAQRDKRTARSEQRLREELNLGLPFDDEPITQRVQCTSCDDKGCGFCVTGDSLAAHFPQD
jgi:hypothetical protein